jgi:uncharacterized protein YdeI (YjbR/CyaY-like superfamily)
MTIQKRVSKKTTLKRKRNALPKSIRALLVKHGLLALYKARPAYQRNDYLGWIAQAKLEATKQKRINQMLDELKQGDRYMKMAWKSQQG